MAGSAGKSKREARKARVHVPHPRDAKHVRRAFEEDAKHPEERTTVSPDELRRWAETGQWPESSD
jgi:hypothetical protein